MHRRRRRRRRVVSCRRNDANEATESRYFSADVNRLQTTWQRWPLKATALRTDRAFQH